MTNLTMIVLSFGCLPHSFWRWTCVCPMHLRKMLFN
nr:Tfp pilus assembly protein [Vibrio cholerae]